MSQNAAGPSQDLSYLSREQLENLVHELRAREQDVVKMQDEWMKEVARLYNSIDKLEVEKRDLERNIRIDDDKIKNLEKEVGTSKEIIGRLRTGDKESDGQLEKRARTAEKECRRLKKELEKSEAENGRLLRELAAAERKNEDHRKRKHEDDEETEMKRLRMDQREEAETQWEMDAAGDTVFCEMEASEKVQTLQRDEDVDSENRLEKDGQTTCDALMEEISEVLRRPYKMDFGERKEQNEQEENRDRALESRLDQLQTDCRDEEQTFKDRIAELKAQLAEQKNKKKEVKAKFRIVHAKKKALKKENQKLREELRKARGEAEEVLEDEGELEERPVIIGWLKKKGTFKIQSVTSEKDYFHPDSSFV